MRDVGELARHAETMADCVVAALAVLLRQRPGAVGDLREWHARRDQRDVPLELLAGAAVEQLLLFARRAAAEEGAREIDRIALVAGGVGVEAEKVARREHAARAFLEIGEGAG